MNICAQHYVRLGSSILLALFVKAFLYSRPPSLKLFFSIMGLCSFGFDVTHSLAFINIVNVLDHIFIIGTKNTLTWGW